MPNTFGFPDYPWVYGGYGGGDQGGYAGGNQEELEGSDWWDSNYNDILQLLQGWMTQAGDPRNLGEQAYQRSEQAAGEGLGWNMWDAFKDVFPERQGVGAMGQMTPQKYYNELLGQAKTIGSLPAGDEAIAANMAQSVQSQGNILNQLMSQYGQEQGIKSPIHTGRMQTPFSSANLALNQLGSALSGLQGFRGQDIQLFMEQLRTQAMAAQARAMAEGQQQGGGLWDLLSALGPLALMFMSGGAGAVGGGGAV